MHLYPKNVLGRKYVRLMTGSPYPYLLFLAGLIALFLFLTLSTKVEVVRMYPVELVAADGVTTLAVDVADIPVGTAYVYANKNQAVYPVRIQRTEPHGDGLRLYLNEDQTADVLRSFGDQRLYLDVPQGKVALLYLILVKGGKGGG